MCWWGSVATWMCWWGRVATWTTDPAPIRTAAADSPVMTRPRLSCARTAREYRAGRFGLGGGEPSTIPQDCSIHRYYSFLDIADKYNINPQPINLPCAVFELHTAST